MNHQLVLHPHTAEQLKSLVESWPQALIVTGADGLGKKQAVIQHIGKRHQSDIDSIARGEWPQMMIITRPESKQTIGIEQIRELSSYLQLKDSQSRYILIDEAETMTLPAQNAFLKTFEESQTNVHIVLVTSQLDRLVPTVRSRAQHIAFKPPTNQQLAAWLAANHPDHSDQSLVHIAEGSPGMLHSILSDSERSKSVKQDLQLARQILSGSKSDRLKLANNLKSDRQRSKQIIDYLRVMCRSAMRSVDSVDDAKTWAGRAEACLKASQALDRFANIRLVWLRLMLEL